jgi:hypothetical protein
MEDWTVNADYFWKFVENHLRPAVWWKCAHVITGAPPLVLPDSACCHLTCVKDLLAWWQWETQEPVQAKWFCSLMEVMWAEVKYIADINENLSADGKCGFPEIWSCVHHMARDNNAGM